MKKLWDRSETFLAVVFIVIYVTGNSLLDQASERLGIEMVLTLPFDLVLIAVMLGFIRTNGLREYYAICAPKTPARQMLYYIPMIVVSTVNIWFGIVFNKGLADGLVYFLAMIATGITEELLFRGFLFRAMSRRNPRAAVILVSVLFGAGHLMNLFNGSGMTPLENICQVFYAVAVGFLFVAVLIRSGSLIPCMIAHAAFNALSVFANNPMHEKYQIPIALSLCAISLASGVYYLRSEKKWF